MKWTKLFRVPRLKYCCWFFFFSSYFYLRYQWFCPPWPVCMMSFEIIIVGWAKFPKSDTNAGFSVFYVRKAGWGMWSRWSVTLKAGTKPVWSSQRTLEHPQTKPVFRYEKFKVIEKVCDQRWTQIFHTNRNLPKLLIFVWSSFSHL